MSRSLRLVSLRELQRHPGQALLSLLGVALGVSVMVAVDLANDSAREAFRLSMETLTGNATHRITGRDHPLAERLFTHLRTDLGTPPATPVVEGFVTLRGETFRLFGVDLFSDGEFRASSETLSAASVAALVTRPNTVLIARNDARRLDLSAGSSVQIESAGRLRTIEIVGEYLSTPPAATEGILIADIATAQELLERVGELDRIELILDAATAATLAQRLPQQVQLHRIDNDLGDQTRMTEAFHTNLTAMSLLALLVGALLVYNTMTLALLRRRRLLGLLRVIGATRADLFRLVLIEAFWLGVLGSLLGTLFGVLIGKGLIALVTQTINDLYFVLTVNSLLVSPTSLVKGFLIGLGVTLAAALAPALDATRLSPHEATGRSNLERLTHRLAPRWALLGTLLAGLALASLALPSKALSLAFGALFLFVLGFALVVPWLVGRLTRWLTTPLAMLFGNIGRLAARGVDAGLSRTGIAVAALSVAVAATVGVETMIESFRSTVGLWLQQSLISDIYIRLPEHHRTGASLPPRLLKALRRIDGVASISLGRPNELASPFGKLRMLALRDPAKLADGFRLKDALHGVWHKFTSGRAVLISEPLAYHHDLAPGDDLPLETPYGVHRFVVGGVFYDYSSDRGRLVIDGKIYAKLWHDDGTTTAGLRIDPNADYQSVLSEVRRTVTRYRKPYQVVANAEIRAQSMAIFERTFTITGVLRLLAVGVALIGVLTALLALQLEKAREHATLRAIGVTPRQLGALVSLECGLIGWIAGLLALPLGWVLAQLLIGVINRRAFGWSMQSLLPPGVFADAWLLAVGAALLAGAYPAWRLAVAPPITALRDE